MKTRIATTLQLCLATVLGLGVAILPASAAGVDVVNVRLDISTSIGKTVLPPGEYVVRAIQESGNSAVLEFMSANGHSVNAVVREIPVAGGEDATHSSVILRSEEGTYQVDKIWMEGKDYGYQLITADRH